VVTPVVPIDVVVKEIVDSEVELLISFEEN